MIDGDVRRLMVAIDRIDNVYYRAQRASGMKESLFMLAYALADGTPRSQKQILAEWDIPRSTLNTTVLEQERTGNVRLVPGRGHQKLVELTKRGRDELLGALEPVFCLEGEASRDSGVDITALATQMERLASSFERCAAHGGDPSDGAEEMRDEVD